MSDVPQDDEITGKSYDGALMGRLSGYLRPYRAYVVAAFTFLLLAALADLVGPFLVGYALDHAIRPALAAHPGAALDGYRRQLLAIALIYLLSLLASAGFRYGQLVLLNMLGQSVMYDLRLQMFGHMQRLSLGFFDRNPVGRLMTRLTNDVDALNELLTARGEAVVDQFVVSMPMSARLHANVSALGNEVGAVPVAIPATGEMLRRLEQTADVTRSAKRTARGSSMAILGPIFRLLARLGVLGWFINRQRLVHTFVTNLRGPDRRLSFVGTAIDEIAAIAVITGNVTAAFAAISYAGTMTVTVIADPDTCPDLPALRDGLQRQFDLLAAYGA